MDDAHILKKAGQGDDKSLTQPLNQCFIAQPIVNIHILN